ncbi:MAG: C1 family peptidase [Polyangiaceae bacterium]|nr:C1 family peptidase [Polyangiaceae bacterium]
MKDSDRFSERYGISTDARADVLDFRDSLYRPTMTEVPPRISLEEYQAYDVPVLDQGRNNGCTGFAVATIAHYLLRKRKVDPDHGLVSQNMLYTMARKYDEYPGEDDGKGSSLRGAMKGWHKHGVCAYDKWPWSSSDLYGTLTQERSEDAALRPLGLYQRVNHKDIALMHNAIAEVGIIAASAVIPFNGWFYGAREDGVIPSVDKTNPFIAPWGGHAFVIVGYDAEGFWIQNSWGPGWGKAGFGRLGYDDWLQYGLDAWVGRLGAPIKLTTSRERRHIGFASRTFADLRPHLISIDDHGQLQRRGAYGTTSEDVRMIIEEDFLNITRTWKKRRLMLIAGGGLRRQIEVIDRMSRLRPKLLKQQIYPLEFLWETDHYPRLLEILHRAAEGRRHDGYDPKAFGFMIDRRDDALEPMVRRMGGKAEWDRMKLSAGDAIMDADVGGVREAVNRIAALMEKDASIELHLVGHSAGVFLLAPLAQLVTAGRGKKIDGGPMRGQYGLGLPIESVSLLAPASAIESFRDTFMPAIKDGAIRRFALFTLTDEAELMDHCEIYSRSLLYLVSNALERRPRVPGGSGVSLLGMERSLLDPENADVLSMLTGAGLVDPRARGADAREPTSLRPPAFARAEWIKGPNTRPPPYGSEARRHEDFEADATTWRSIIARIMNQPLPEDVPPTSAREQW